MATTKFESVKTVKGNIGVSYVSQEAADLQAEMMDKNDCYNCTNCNRCYKCYNCNYCNYCYKCYYCNNCTDCNNCDNCTDCYSCDFVPRWDKTAATSLHSISGLTWPVTFSETQMQIGCQSHTIEEWKGFSEEKIAEMEERAVELWEKYKDFIFSFIALTLQDKPNQRLTFLLFTRNWQRVRGLGLEFRSLHFILSKGN